MAKINKIIDSKQCFLFPVKGLEERNPLLKKVRTAFAVSQLFRGSLSSVRGEAMVEKAIDLVKIARKDINRFKNSPVTQNIKDMAAALRGRFVARELIDLREKMKATAGNDTARDRQEAWQSIRELDKLLEPFGGKGTVAELEEHLIVRIKFYALAVNHPLDLGHGQRSGRYILEQRDEIEAILEFLKGRGGELFLSQQRMKLDEIDESLLTCISEPPQLGGAREIIDDLLHARTRTLVNTTRKAWWWNLDQITGMV